MDLKKVTRLEVINHRKDSLAKGEGGRRLTLWDPKLQIEASLQDGGRTLKIFVDDRQ